MRGTIAIAMLSTGLAAGILCAEEGTDEKSLQRIGKPAPAVVAQSAFELKVETKSRFPNENRPAASVPVEEKSLAVTIQPEKTDFAGNGPLAFAVTLENKSQSPLMLYGAEHLGVASKLVVSNQGNGNQWSISGAFENANRQGAVELGPGETKTYTLVVEANVVVAPQPIPFPLPRPIPVPAFQKEQAVRRIFPPRPPIVVGPALPCGEGKCRARLFLEFQTDPLAKYRHPTWTGKIATAAVDFQVGKSQPIPAPVPPIVGVPLTKQQAVQLAQSAAEQVLQSNYRPVDGLKPAHQGAWITNAEQTANVTERKAGGWTIAWTHFPKKGFSYNVKIDVSTSGATTVQEVFTSYSPE